MALMYKPNPVILLVDDDGTVLFAIVPRDLSLTAGDLFELRCQAEQFGLQFLVVESVTIDSTAWLASEILWTAHRRDAAATAPRTVPGLLAKGASYMDDLSIDLRIVDGLNDGLNEGEPFGDLTPEAMAQRLRFRLANYDRQRQGLTNPQGNGGKARAGAVVHRLGRRPEGVRAQPDVASRAITRAADLANKNPVSLSALWEMCCHDTAVTDAVRVLERSTV
jgi:hypothetical protein